MTKAQFDGDGFYSAIDSHRESRGITWKKVAEESHISASTLTRLAQGKRPDVDSLAALVSWSGLKADSFVRAEFAPMNAEPLAEIMTLLRADRHLSPEAVAAMEAVLKATYKNLRSKE